MGELEREDTLTSWARNEKRIADLERDVVVAQAGAESWKVTARTWRNAARVLRDVVVDAQSRLAVMDDSNRQGRLDLEAAENLAQSRANALEALQDQVRDYLDTPTSNRKEALQTAVGWTP